MVEEVEKFLEWQKISDQLKELKEVEARMRTDLCISVFGKNTKPVKIELGGYVIKATPKFNFKVDEAVFDSIYDELSVEEKAAVKMQPKLVKSKYNKLDSGNMLNEAITVTPGRPTLNISVLDSDPVK